MQPIAGPAKAKNAMSVPNTARARKLLEEAGRSRKPAREDGSTGWVGMIISPQERLARFYEQNASLKEIQRGVES